MIVAAQAAVINKDQSK